MYIDRGAERRHEGVGEEGKRKVGRRERPASKNHEERAKRLNAAKLPRRRPTDRHEQSPLP